MAKRRRNPLYRAWHWLRRWQPFYWLRAHTYNRYHIVDCGRRDNPTGYRWGWTDVDSLLLYASFELLRRFVHDEDGLDQLALQGATFRVDAEKRPESHAALMEVAGRRDAIYKEVKLLYDWWTIYRKEEHNLFNDGTHRDRLHEKDTEMLCRLMRVRGALWT